MFRKTCLAASLIASAILLVGCEGSSDKKPAEKASATAPSAMLPSGLILTTAPADAQNVVEAKQKAKTGDEIVVRGRIGGSKQPFVEGRAIFQLVDVSLPTCDENPGDTCPTPWDYCCEPVDVKVAKSLTVQVVGEDGKPLKIDLNGQGGLKPSAHVVIKGKVAERPDEKTMTVRAEGVYVQPAGSKGS
jgi:hypothetical protein